MTKETQEVLFFFFVVETYILNYIIQFIKKGCSMTLLLSGDAHPRRPLHKIHGVLFCFVFFRFLGQLLEHPVWRHLQLPAH